MKNVLSFLLIFVALQVNAQGDFDFSFYPSGVYQKYFERFERDTTVVDSIARNIKIDSTKTDVQVVIKKEGDRLTITDIKYPSGPIYSERVRFLGVLEDGFGSLFYESLSVDKEQIVVNPTRGFAVISFKKCFTEVGDGKISPWTAEATTEDAPDFCNFINHNFGNIALNKYRPK
jgi:hypothetical protein